MPARPGRPDVRGPKPEIPAPAVTLSDCPNCGRKGVAVFPVVHPDKPDNTPRRVCPHCCPKAPGDS